MIRTDEDDEFERIAHEAKMKGQSYYFEDHPTDPEKLIFRKPSRKLDDDDIQDYVRPWVGLTDQEIGQVFQEKCTEHGQLLNERAFRIAARWAEEKLKEKNT
jgi:hypothetical protein